MSSNSPTVASQLFLDPEETDKKSISSFVNQMFRGVRSRFAHLEKLSIAFSSRRLKSVSIFSILNHPCFFTVSYYLFSVFRS